jgi:hypothetical protein
MYRKDAGLLRLLPGAGRIYPEARAECPPHSARVGVFSCTLVPVPFRTRPAAPASQAGASSRISLGRTIQYLIGLPVSGVTTVREPIA